MCTTTTTTTTGREIENLGGAECGKVCRVCVCCVVDQIGDEASVVWVLGASQRGLSVMGTNREVCENGRDARIAVEAKRL